MNKCYLGFLSNKVSKKTILHHLGWGFTGWLGGWGCHKDPFQTKFQFCQVLHMAGIRLQLLCDVKIEVGTGSLPYLGNYLDFQFVSPGRDRPLSGFPICKPCLDVRQNPSKDTHFPSYGRRPANQNQNQPRYAGL